MPRNMFFLIMAAIFVLQLFMCLKLKRVLWKLLPLVVEVLLFVICVVNYALSGWSNWAFLILILFLSMPFGAIGAGWLVYGIYCAVKRF